MIYTQGELDLYLYCSRCNIHHMLLVAVGKKCFKNIVSQYFVLRIYILFLRIYVDFSRDFFRGGIYQAKKC